MNQKTNPVSVRRNISKRKNSSRKIWMGLGLVVLVAAGAGGTFLYKFNTSDATIAAGNKEFAAQQYEAALEKYTAAETAAPLYAEPFYNAANALYKQSKFQEAQPLLEQALQRSNEKIAELIQFNLGNVAFSGNQFEQAIAHFEDALRINPDDKDAKYNLELALLRQRQENPDQQNTDQQKQDQQQKQDEQKQDQQSQDKQNQGQQGQDQQKQGQDGQDQQQGKQGKQGQDQSQDKNGQGQTDEQKSGQQGQDQQDQQQGQQGQDKIEQKDGQNGQSQQQGQQNQPQPNGQNGQGQPQNGEPQQGNGAAGQPTDEQGQEQGMGYVLGDTPGELTEEQADQLLAAVGSNSQTLMEALQQYFYVPGDEPEKDW